MMANRKHPKRKNSYRYLINNWIKLLIFDWRIKFENGKFQGGIIPENLRPRNHIDQILKLDEDAKLEKTVAKAIDSTLKSLKNLYDNAIKPLEMLYKYRDLSNRHFGG